MLGFSTNDLEARICVCVCVITQRGDGVQVVSGEMKLVVAAVPFGAHVGERHLVLDLCRRVTVLLDVSCHHSRIMFIRLSSVTIRCHVLVTTYRSDTPALAHLRPDSSAVSERCASVCSKT